MKFLAADIDDDDLIRLMRPFEHGDLLRRKNVTDFQAFEWENITHTTTSP